MLNSDLMLFFGVAALRRRDLPAFRHAGIDLSRAQRG